MRPGALQFNWFFPGWRLQRFDRVLQGPDLVESPDEHARQRDTDQRRQNQVFPGTHAPDRSTKFRSDQAFSALAGITPVMNLYELFALKRASDLQMSMNSLWPLLVRPTRQPALARLMSPFGTSSPQCWLMPKIPVNVASPSR